VTADELYGTWGLVSSQRQLVYTGGRQRSEAVSVAAFRKLSPPLRRRFKKHTPPVTYIRAEDPRRFR
jgi:hypothetical protein